MIRTFSFYPFTISLYLPPMSAKPKPYSQLYVNAWTILTVVFSATLFLAYTFGTHLLTFFHWVWDLLRYLASPII